MSSLVILAGVVFRYRVENRQTDSVGIGNYSNQMDMQHSAQEACGDWANSKVQDVQ